jgi:hypothetical protein
MNTNKNQKPKMCDAKKTQKAKWISLPPKLTQGEG